MPLDPNIIIPSVIAGTSAIFAARSNGSAKRAAKNTTPNGHGPIPHAIGTVIELVEIVDKKVGRIDKKVNRVVREQTAHAESDDAAFEAIGTRLERLEGHGK